MSFYEILGVEKSCSADDIECAAKSCVKQLHDDVHGEMKQKTIDYIKSIASILLSEEGRECYDNIMSTKQSYTSPLRASLILKRVAWYNNISTVQFGESFLQHLQSTSRELRAPPLRCGGTKDLKCRWCDDRLAKKDIHTVICDCDSRSGHTECVNEFVKEHKRCPVCRHPLLLRHKISKYMLFNKNPKYIVR